MDADALMGGREGVFEKGVSLQGSEEETLPAGANWVKLCTTKGDLPAILHPAGASHSGIIWLSGARGGLNGPAGGLYATLAYALTSSGITSLRLHYRQPNLFPSCVADVLIGITFLKQKGIRKIALVGHSFGGAVAITAGAVSSEVVGVASLAGQTFGTDLVPDLSPRPLLIAHGTLDLILDSSCAHNIYARAKEPKRLVIFPGASHALIECQAELEDLLVGWLIENLGGKRPTLDWYDLPIREISLPGHQKRTVRVCLGDITEIRAEALVCPASEELTMWEGVAAAIVDRGGGEIAVESAALAPGRLGEVIVTSAGQLAAKHVLHAVISAPRRGASMPLEETLIVAVKGCFDAAESRGLKSIAFPALGAVGYLSFEKAAAILLKVAAERLSTSPCLRTVSFVVSGAGAYRAFAKALDLAAGVVVLK